MTLAEARTQRRWFMAMRLIREIICVTLAALIVVDIACGVVNARPHPVVALMFVGAAAIAVDAIRSCLRGRQRCRNALRVLDELIEVEELERMHALK